MKQNIHRDHLILPRTSLMEFANSGSDTINVLFLGGKGNNQIELRHAKSFHREKNYYDDHVDDIIKRTESLIGKKREILKDYIEKNNIEDPDMLRDFAIDIICLQFNRMVMVDPFYRDEFIKSEKSRLRNEKIELEKQIKQNEKSAEIQERISVLQDKIENFESNLDDEKFPKYFQKHYMICGDKLNLNPHIVNQYKNFIPVIGYIPENINASYLLMPQHYFGVDSMARVVLAPRLSIELYPPDTKLNSSHIRKITEDEALSFVPRAFESAMEMSVNYRQLIGKKEFLEKVKSKIDLCYRIIENTSESEVFSVTLNNNEVDDNLFFLLLIVLYSERKNKIIIKTTQECIDNIEDLENVWKITLDNFGLHLVVLSDEIIKCSFAPIFTDMEAALKSFSK